MPTREEILAAARHGKPQPLDVPEWGGTVWLRVLSAKDQLALTEGIEQRDVPFRVLIGCVCDEDGNAIFEQGDEDALMEQPFPVIMRVFAEAAKLNGLSSRELEEAVSHFEPAQGVGSSSG